MNDFDWNVIRQNWPFLAEGMGLSALLVVVSVAGGVAIGGLLALLRLSRLPLIPGIVAAYVTVMRSLPLVLVLFWFYFLGPMLLGRPIGSLTAALIAFVMFEAAFYCEIIRAGIASVRPGQTLAALATGMTNAQAMRLVVLPTALRAMVPLLLNQAIIVFQDTSLVYVVTLHDFMTSASIVAARDSRPIEMYSLVALVYLAICLATSRAVAFFWKPAAR